MATCNQCKPVEQKQFTKGKSGAVRKPGGGGFLLGSPRQTNVDGQGHGCLIYDEDIGVGSMTERWVSDL